MSLNKITTRKEGTSLWRATNVDENEQSVKDSETNVYGWYFVNTAASDVYIKFYNDTAANVTVGTTTPIMTLYLPSGGAIDSLPTEAPIFHCDTALTIAATGAVGDGDTTAITDIIGHVMYA